MEETAQPSKLGRSSAKTGSAGSSDEASDSDVELGEPVTEGGTQAEATGTQNQAAEQMEEMTEEFQEASLALFQTWLAERKAAEARRLALLKEKEADEVCRTAFDSDDWEGMGVSFEQSLFLSGDNLECRKVRKTEWKWLWI